MVRKLRAFTRSPGSRLRRRTKVPQSAALAEQSTEIAISEGPVNKFLWVSFSVAAGSLPELVRSLESDGVRQIDGPDRAGDGSWFADPDGLPVHLTEAPLPAARRVDQGQLWNWDGVYDRVELPRWREISGITHPRYLGHIIKFTPDLRGTEHFYLNQLGLRLSDRIPSRISFLQLWNWRPSHLRS